jgi:hypothetical protein
MKDSEPVSAVVGRSTVRCVIQPDGEAWFKLDLIDKVAVVSHYSLKHYSSWDIECLRSWKLEGSNNGSVW